MLGLTRVKILEVKCHPVVKEIEEEFLDNDLSFSNFKLL